MLARFELEWLLGDDRDVIISVSYHAPESPPDIKIAPVITGAKWKLVHILSGDMEAEGPCTVDLSEKDGCTYLAAKVCPLSKGEYNLRFTFEAGENKRVAEVIMHVR